MKAGDIVVVNFQGAKGIKRRPAVIVSTELYNRTRPDLILAVITSRIDSARYPTDYLLQDWVEAGLHKPSAFRAYLVTQEAAAVYSRTGALTERDWNEVKTRLRLAIATEEK